MSDNGEADGGEFDMDGMQQMGGGAAGQKKKGNIMPVWYVLCCRFSLVAGLLICSVFCRGNEKTMNLNNMILTNIQQSPYYKVQLAEIKTYHEVRKYNGGEWLIV